MIYIFRVQPVFEASYKDSFIRTNIFFLINTINFIILSAVDGEKIRDKFEANIKQSRGKWVCVFVSIVTSGS